MNRLTLILAVLLVTVGAAAQTGLYKLSFQDDLNTADSLLFSQGFQAEEIEGSLVKYYPLANDRVESVVLFVNPETELVAGWFVLYSQENTPEEDDYVIQRLHLMHGDEVQILGDRNQLVWGLDATRSVHAQYSSEGNFCVLYYDSEWDGLFELPPSAELRLPHSAD